MTQDIFLKSKSKQLRHSISFLLNIPNDENMTDEHYQIFKDKISFMYYHQNKKVFDIAKEIDHKPRQTSHFLFYKLKLERIIPIKGNKDPKLNYRKQCQFKFSPFDEPNILGYDLLQHFGFTKGFDENSLHRDHMVSIDYGWENNIEPKIISHPANCRLLLARENIRKGSGCSISIEQLHERIRLWNTNDNNVEITETSSKSESHRENISKSLRGRKWYNDGTRNISISENEIIPNGFTRGMLKTKRINESKDNRYNNEYQRTMEYYRLYEEYKATGFISFADFVRKNSDITSVSMHNRFKRLNLSR